MSDLKLGMFVAVIQNVTPLAHSRLKVKRIGEIVGIYDNFVNLLLYSSNIENIIENIDSKEPIILHRKLYIESFKYDRIIKLDREIIYEE